MLESLGVQDLVPIGPKVVPFLGIPYRILNMNLQNGTTLGPMGRPKRGVGLIMGVWSQGLQDFRI